MKKLAIVYVGILTGGLAQADNLEDVDNINLCLLCPYDKLIQEIQKEIAKIKK